MASGGQPDGGKPRAKGVSGGKAGGKGSPGQKRSKQGTGGGPGKAPLAPRKVPPLPLLAVWILAVAALSAIIYFSARPRPHDVAHPPVNGAVETSKPAQPHSTANKPAEQGNAARAKPAGPAHEESADAHVPPGPTIAPKSFKSSDLPADPASSKETLALNRPAPPAPAPGPPTAPVHARAAIIIDDFGPDAKIAGEFISLPFPVTVSVMPFQAHSTEIADLARSHGREVILHLPMEPVEYPKMNPGPGALLLSMSEDAMRRGIGSALDVSPYFTGVNNHMGSKMTQDAKAMKIVLNEINRRGLYFLDSYTSPKSKAWSIARDMKMPVLKRDIFLDHNVSARSVREQITRFIRIARTRGTALAIGHPHEVTLKELRAAADEFGRQGIKIAPASELIKESLNLTPRP